MCKSCLLACHGNNGTRPAFIRREVDSDTGTVKLLDLGYCCNHMTAEGDPPASMVFDMSSAEETTQFLGLQFTTSRV